MKTFKQFCAEMSFSTGSVAINAVAGGNIAGIGFGPQGEPGGRKQIMTKRMLRRKPSNVASKVST